MVAGSWYDPVLTAHLPDWRIVTNYWCAYFLCLYALVICDHCPPALGNVEDFDFVSAVPQSNHHTVGTASWQNHDSSPPQSVIILHCHVCLCLSNTYISFALRRQCKSKIISHLPGYSRREPRPRAQSIIAYNDVCHELRAMCQAYASLRLTWRIAQLLLTTNTRIHRLGRGECIRPRKSH